MTNEAPDQPKLLAGGNPQIPKGEGDAPVQVAFFYGTSLHPLPPGKSKTEETRYLDIHEQDTLDEAPFADWVEQASRLPGERM